MRAVNLHATVIFISRLLGYYASMDKQKFKPAKLLIWDLDNVIYPYDDAFNVACHEAAARAAVSLGFEDRGGGGQ